MSAAMNTTVNLHLLPDPEPLVSCVEDGDDHSLFVDLGSYLDGTAEQEVPSVGEAWLGTCLFYSGRLNEIHAEPGFGKTNVIMAACISVLNEGGTVLYIDPEDTPKGFATRMLLLGADPDSVRTRVSYLHNPEPPQIKAAQDWAKNEKPDIVVLDGLAESIAAQGLNEDKAGDVLEFFRVNLRPFAEIGASVVIADHVAKSTEGRGQFARGSSAKAGRYDGVSYELVIGDHYSPNQAGHVKLKIAKDRNGGAGPRGKIVAELHFTPRENGTAVEFRRPLGSEGGPFRPTGIMQKIREHLTFTGASTKRGLRNLGGKAKYIDLAIDLMVAEGELVMTREGQKHVYSLVAGGT